MNTITAVGSDVWQVAAPNLRLPLGLRMPVASPVIRLPDGSLVIYSPVAFDDAGAAAINALGDVRHIVAPSLYHHLYAKDAAARWPAARLHATPSLAAKRPDLTIHSTLDATDPAWRDVLDVQLIAGAPKLDEVVLFHRPSGTLACADFVFNVTQPANVMTRMVLAMTGTGGRELRQSRVWRFTAKDRAELRGSIERILTWPIAQVVPVHGEPCAVDAPTLASKLRV